MTGVGPPRSDSPYGEPVAAWSSRAYRATGDPLAVEWEGEWGIALPLLPPPWWYLPFFGALTLGAASCVVAGTWLLVRGEAPDGPLPTALSIALVLVLTGLFALATRGTLRRRHDPGQVVVTPTRLVADRVEAPWEAIDAVWARQEHRLGHVRAIDIASLRTSGRGFTLFEAADLRTDPRIAVAVLRRLHLDPSLRARLSTDEARWFFVTGETRSRA